MDYTTNLNLKKPNVNEYYSIGDINDNMDTIDEALQDLSTGSGDLSGLTTTAKDSLVEAINELDGNIGDLSGLTTTAKTNLVNAVNELNTNVSELNQNMSDLNTRSIAVRGQNWMSDVDFNSIEGNGIFFLSTNISNAPLSNTAWAIMI